MKVRKPWPPSSARPARRCRCRSRSRRARATARPGPAARRRAAGTTAAPCSRRGRGDSSRTTMITGRSTRRGAARRRRGCVMRPPPTGRRLQVDGDEHGQDRGQHQRLRRRGADVAAVDQVVVDPDRDDLGARAAAGEQVDVVEVVEGPDEPQHGEHRDRRQQLRQHDVAEPLRGRRTVDRGRLLEGAGHGLDPGGEEEEGERERPPRLEQHDRQQRRADGRSSPNRDGSPELRKAIGSSQPSSVVP